MFLEDTHRKHNICFLFSIVTLSIHSKNYVSIKKMATFCPLRHFLPYSIDPSTKLYYHYHNFVNFWPIEKSNISNRRPRRWIFFSLRFLDLYYSSLYWKVVDCCIVNFEFFNSRRHYVNVSLASCKAHAHDRFHSTDNWKECIWFCDKWSTTKLRSRSSPTTWDAIRYPAFDL